MSDDLLARLREPANGPALTPDRLFFRPEQVQRGFERMRNLEPCRNPDYVDGSRLRPCSSCWAAMLDAFVAGVRDA